MWRWLTILGLFLSPCGFAIKCEVQWDNQTVSLERPVRGEANLSQVLLFLQSFATSQNLAKEFTHGLEKKEIGLKPFAQGKGRAIAKNPTALFDLVENIPTIFVGESEFGVMAVTLFHEIVHAFDEKYAARFREWSAKADTASAERTDLLAKARALVKERDTMVFHAERRAYDFQRALLDEMSAKFECAAEYFDDAERRKLLYARDLTDDEIIQIYRLSFTPEKR